MTWALFIRQDFEGNAIVKSRMHWVQCEALASAKALCIVTEDLIYEAYYRRFFAFLNEYFLESGSYIHELDENLDKSTGTWSGKPDVYHGATWIVTSLYPLSGSHALAALLGDKK